MPTGWWSSSRPEQTQKRQSPLHGRAREGGPVWLCPDLKDLVQGSTCATSSRPRVSAFSSFSCLPDEPRKMRGFAIRSSRYQIEPTEPNNLSGARSRSYNLSVCNLGCGCNGQDEFPKVTEMVPNLLFRDAGGSIDRE